jgi:hypothetical protein
MKQNKIVYLKNGQAANFVKKIDEENYIVQPHIIFYDHEGNEDYDYSDKIVVDKIYSKPPIEKIEKEYLEKINAVKNKIEELSTIAREVQISERKLREAKEKTTDLKNNIFNKSELKSAESITVFTDSIVPRTLSEKMKKELKINIEINFRTGQERIFAYNFYDYDENWGSGEKIDLEYGLLLDVNEEELLNISKERADKMYDSGNLQDYELKRTDNKYLSEKLIKVKNEVIKTEKLKRKEGIKSDIEKKMKELRKLEQSL